MKETLKFFISPKFLKNLGLVIVSGFLLLFLVFVWLKFFTHHGEEFSVPDFRGLTITQVEQLAKEKNLRFKINDSVFNAPGKRGTIMEQIPPKDFMVKENRTIFLTIKAFQPEFIPMPALTGNSLVQVKADLETYGLRIGKLIYQPSKYQNVILDQQNNGVSIVAGEFIPKGTRIDLVLGRKIGMDKTSVPDLIGMTRTQAEFKIAEFMMNVSEVIYDETVISYSDSLDAKVRKQQPKKHISMLPGAEVKLWMSMISDTDSTENNIDSIPE